MWIDALLKVIKCGYIRTTLLIENEAKQIEDQTIKWRQAKLLWIIEMIWLKLKENILLKDVW